MASYYKILGVSDKASDGEIKKTYRRLAMQYHPDRNSSEEAGARFIQITEAYQELLKGNTEPTEKPGFAGKGRWAEDLKRRHDPVWRKAFAERLRKARILAEEEGIQYYHDYINGYKFKLSLIASILSAVFALVLAIDVFTPGEVVQERVLHMKYEGMAYPNEEGDARHAYYIVLVPEQRNYYEVDIEDYRELQIADIINVERSVIFCQPLMMQMDMPRGWRMLDFSHYLYDMIYLLLVLFLIPLLRFVIQRADVSFYFFDFAVRLAFPVLVAAILGSLLLG